VNIVASVDDLTRGYEALRAEAVGELPGVPPRGRAVLLHAGLVAWMRALPPLTPAPRPGRSRIDAPAMTPAGMHGELVSVLAGMALRAGRRWCRAS
jgi:hypothetical protein